MKNIEYQIDNWFLSRKSFIWIYSILLILTGLIYILVEFSRINTIKDSLFIGLLFGGSFILLFGIKWIQTLCKEKISEFYENLDDSKKHTVNDFEKLTKKIFKNPLTIIAGVIYGLSVGSVPFLLKIWSEHFELNILLSLFLFIVNFLTGTALFSLVMLFFFLYKTSNHLVIGLYDRYNPASNFITDLSKRASIVASFYIAFSITSIYFSELPINKLTIGYSIFAGIIIIIAYLLPMIPIRNKIQLLKREAVVEISGHIQKELENLLKNARLEKDINIERYDSLIELRTKLSDLQSSPIGMKAIWNSIYIILITLLPVIIQVVLEIIIK
jgi:hypothetical protein